MVVETFGFAFADEEKIFENQSGSSVVLEVEDAVGEVVDEEALLSISDCKEANHEGRP